MQRKRGKSTSRLRALFNLYATVLFLSWAIIPARNLTVSLVIMDNSSIHLDPRVAKLVEGAGAIIVYSAPYCPHLTPIEEMFHQWKSSLKGLYVAFNQNWHDVYVVAINAITPD